MKSIEELIRRGPQTEGQKNRISQYARKKQNQNSVVGGWYITEPIASPQWGYDRIHIYNTKDLDNVLRQLREACPGTKADYRSVAEALVKATNKWGQMDDELYVDTLLEPLGEGELPLKEAAMYFGDEDEYIDKLDVHKYGYHEMGCGVYIAYHMN